MAALTGEPASSCGRCGKLGYVSENQRSRTGTLSEGALLDKRQRFHCPCGNEWLVDTEAALLHGRFLDRANLR